jgi:hypothetical protein
MFNCSLRFDLPNFSLPSTFNADPDPPFIFNADPDLTFHFNTDPDMNPDPDPVPHQNDANLQPLSTDTQRLHFEPPCHACIVSVPGSS